MATQAGIPWSKPLQNKARTKVQFASESGTAPASRYRSEKQRDIRHPSGSTRSLVVGPLPPNSTRWAKPAGMPCSEVSQIRSGQDTEHHSIVCHSLRNPCHIWICLSLLLYSSTPGGGCKTLNGAHGRPHSAEGIRYLTCPFPGLCAISKSYSCNRRFPPGKVRAQVSQIHGPLQGAVSRSLYEIGDHTSNTENGTQL